MLTCTECGEQRIQVQPYGKAFAFCTDRACADIFFDDLALDRESERQYADFHSRED